MSNRYSSMGLNGHGKTVNHYEQIIQNLYEKGHIWMWLYSLSL
jgi:hypothetical protein